MTAAAGKLQVASLAGVLAASGAVLLACLRYTGLECSIDSGPGDQIQTSASRPASTAPAAPPIRGTWKLIYHDDFDTNPLTRGYAMRMWGKPGVGAEIDDEKNVTVEEGILSLTAKRSAAGFTSGQIHSGGDLLFGGKAPPLFSFKFGYIEARMELPTVKGTWPAFWMMPTPNPTLHDEDGEIDILDNGDGDPAHMSAGSSAHKKTFRHDRIIKILPGFHRIGLEWQSDRVTWYIDGNAVQTNSNPETIPQVAEYFILGLQVNDGKKWGAAPDSNAAFPVRLRIDSVNVWQRDPADDALKK